MVGETLPLGYKMFGAAVSACWADFVTFPFDTAKVRLQIQGETRKGSRTAKIKYGSIFHTMLTIFREEGLRSLYNGLIPGLHRQLCFSAIRIGFYENVRNFYQNLFFSGKKEDEDYSNLIRVLAGLTTGALAVCIAQPTDVVKIRFQAQAQGNAEYTYQSALKTYGQIAREEGIVNGLWKGTVANAVRNSIVNVCEIVTYDIIKTFFLRNKIMDDHIGCHFSSAIVAGIVTTFIASPIDVVKTRYMNSPKGTYRNAILCGHRMLMDEGLQAFFKGFTPSCIRLVGWNLVMWITFEKVKWGLENIRKKRGYE